MRLALFESVVVFAVSALVAVGPAAAQAQETSTEEGKVLPLGYSLRAGYGTWHGESLPREHGLVLDGSLYASLGPLEIDAVLTLGGGSDVLLTLGVPIFLHLTPTFSQESSGAFVGVGFGIVADGSGVGVGPFVAGGWRQYLSERMVLRVELRGGNHGSEEDENFGGPYVITGGIELPFIQRPAPYRAPADIAAEERRRSEYRWFSASAGAFLIVHKERGSGGDGGAGALVEGALILGTRVVETGLSLALGTGSGSFAYARVPLLFHLNTSFSRSRSSVFLGGGVGGLAFRDYVAPTMFWSLGYRSVWSSGRVLRLEVQLGTQLSSEGSAPGPSFITAGFEL